MGEIVEGIPHQTSAIDLFDVFSKIEQKAEWFSKIDWKCQLSVWPKEDLLTADV